MAGAEPAPPAGAMGWEEKQVRGYPEFVQTAQRYHGRPIFALFCGDKDAEGRSWCPDCVTGESRGRPLPSPCALAERARRPWSPSAARPGRGPARGSALPLSRLPEEAGEGPVRSLERREVLLGQSGLTTSRLRYRGSRVAGCWLPPQPRLVRPPHSPNGANARLFGGRPAKNWMWILGSVPPPRVRCPEAAVTCQPVSGSRP